MIFDLDLFTVQCHVRTTWSLSSIFSCFSVMYEIPDFWSVSPPGSVSFKNYMIFDLYLFTIQCHIRTTFSVDFDLYLLAVQCHVRTKSSLICISSWFSAMYELHDLWSVSPHGSVSCKNYMIFDLYFLIVGCHITELHDLWSVSSHGSVFC